MLDPIAAFMADMENRYGMARNTSTSYVRDIRQLVRHLQSQDISLLKATEQHLRNYLQDIQNLPISKRTAARKLAAMTAFFAFAWEHGWCKTNPVKNIVPPEYRAGLPIPARDDDMQRLEVSTHRETVWDLRDRLIIGIIVHTGILPSEIVALDTSDIDLMSGTIRVARGGGRERCVAIPSQLVDDLKAYLARLPSQGGPVFISRRHNRLCRESVNLVFHIYADSAGRPVTPRAARHGRAMKAYREGAKPEDIKALLGRKNSISAKRYLLSLGRVERQEKVPQRAIGGVSDKRRRPYSFIRHMEWLHRRAESQTNGGGAYPAGKEFAMPEKGALEDGVFIPMKVLSDSNLSGVAKLLYGLLMRLQSRPMSQADMADLCGCSKRTVSSSFQDLARHSYVSYEAGGPSGVNIYMLRPLSQRDPLA